MADNDVRLNTKGLDGLIKSLKGKLPRARVGVLGANDHRREGSTNATIGAAHEYGSARLPQRSFLRVPITEHLEEYMERKKAFFETEIKEVIRSRSLDTFMKHVGILCEEIVGEAFATGGFGKWPAWKNQSYQNNTGKILVDTQQLRDSIASEVV